MKNKKSIVKLTRKTGGSRSQEKQRRFPTRRQAKSALNRRVTSANAIAAKQAAQAAIRTHAVNTWKQVRENHGINDGKSLLNHLPLPMDSSSPEYPEFHFHIPTSNKDLVTEMAHELLSHEIKKKISKSAFGGDQAVQKHHADIIATEILNQKFAQEKIDKLSNKMGSLEGAVTSQARHDLIGAIPAEVGEVINVALDGIVDTFKSGSTAYSAVKLETTISKMIKAIQNNPVISEEIKSQLTNSAVKVGGKSSRKGRKSRRRGIPLRDARRDARLLIRGGKSCKKITKKIK